jgi:hypothetical protein
VNLSERRTVFIYEAARWHAAMIKAPVIPEPWDQRDVGFRTQMVAAVERDTLPGANRDPKVAHDLWWETYKELGWRYGPLRDPEAKTHPDMVPFEDLGAQEQIKDAVYLALCEIAARFITTRYVDIHEERCPGTPIDLLAERELLLDWIRGADHHSGCSGGWKRGTNPDDEYWPCKCGLREIRGGER